VALADEVSHPLRQHCGLTRAGASNHQQRAMNMPNGLLLALVENDFRRSYSGSHKVAIT
jgi:hypothetical protein